MPVATAGRVRKSLRLVLVLVGGIVAVIAVLALGIIAKGEWDARFAVPNKAPPSFADLAAAGDSNNAPVLILLHGAGLNGRMWDAVRRDLNPAYRAIALDLPGHGARRDELFTPESAAATIAAAARAVAPAPVVLVGDSLGGYAAMVAAHALPRAQLRGLMLGGASSNLMHAALRSYLRDIVVFTIVPLFIDESKAVSRVLATLGVSQADAQAIVTAGVSVRAVPASVRGLLYVDFRALLAAVDQPVLIVNGSGDERALAQEASFVAAAPHATHYRFENCEHGVSMRRSAEFARVLNDFAARAFAPLLAVQATAPQS